MVIVLAGGVGAARFLAGLVQVIPPRDITTVVNVGDDLRLHGLHISPDIDTIIYTLADAINPDTGWGLRDETWNAMSSLERYGDLAWFRLGDRDIGTHLFRTHCLDDGQDLATVTRKIARAWDVEVDVVPVTNQPLRTRITVDGEGEIDFQEYFVRLQHAVPAVAVRFAGAEAARPTDGVLEAISTASRIVIAPSNPLVSIAPVLAVPGVREAVMARRDDVVAISPIIAGRALKGPADRLLEELGHERSVVGVARLYTDLAASLIIDETDRGLAGTVEVTGMRSVVAPTIMSSPADAARLAEQALAA